MGTRQRSGLHREISSIFDGVPLLSKDGSAGGATAVPTTDRSAGRIPPPPSAAPKPAQIKPLEEQQRPQIKPPEPVVPVKKAGQVSKFKKMAKELLVKAKTKILTPPEGVNQRKHMVMVVSIPIMFVVVLFVFGRLFFQSGVKGKSTKDTDKAASSSDPNAQIGWQRPAPYPQDLRDPMKEWSVWSPTAASGDIVVRGIVWSEDNPAAVVGTAVVYQGQTVNGATIVRISRDSVEFEKDGKKWTQGVQN